MSTLAEVLAAHVVGAEYSAGEALELICTCGHSAPPAAHVEHVADELTKAGYGKLAEARADELEAAADDYRHYETPNARIYLRDRAAAIRAGEA